MIKNFEAKESAAMSNLLEIAVNVSVTLDNTGISNAKEFTAEQVSCRSKGLKIIENCFDQVLTLLGADATNSTVESTQKKLDFANNTAKQEPAVKAPMTVVAPDPKKEETVAAAPVNIEPILDYTYQKVLEAIKADGKLLAEKRKKIQEAMVTSIKALNPKHELVLNVKSQDSVLTTVEGNAIEALRAEAVSATVEEATNTPNPIQSVEDTQQSIEAEVINQEPELASPTAPEPNLDDIDADIANVEKGIAPTVATPITNTTTTAPSTSGFSVTAQQLQTNCKTQQEVIQMFSKEFAALKVNRDTKDKFTDHMIDVMKELKDLSPTLTPASNNKIKENVRGLVGRWLMGKAA